MIKREEVLKHLERTALRSESELQALVRQRRAVRIQTVNLHHLALAATDEAFGRALTSSDYTTADGWPVRLLLRFLGRSVQRVTGSEFVDWLLSSSDTPGLRIGLLGAEVQVGDVFVARAEQHGLIIEFREHGRREDWSPAQIVRQISNVDLLLVAVTPPWGEIVARELRSGPTSATIIAVGGAINMAAGTQTMAPRLIRRFGLEWAYRLVQEPRRLWRRYLIDSAHPIVFFILPSGARFARALLRRGPKN